MNDLIEQAKTKTELNKENKKITQKGRALIIQKYPKNPFSSIETKQYRHILDYMPDSINLDDVGKDLDYDGVVEFCKEEWGLTIPDFLSLKEQKDQLKIEEALSAQENLQRMKDEEDRIINEWKQQFSPSMIIKSPAYFEMEKYIEMVCEGYSNFCIVCSRGGFAKTWSSQAILRKKEIDYSYLNSFTSPLELYNFLYDNSKDKIILIDDTEGVWDNKPVISILKNATELNGKRIISWNSTTSKLGGRMNTTEFSSRIILLANQLPNAEKNPHIEALINRSFLCNLKFSYKEKIDIIGEVSKKEYQNLTNEVRNRVFEFIKRNTNEATKDLSIRTLIKCYHFYQFNKELWKELGIKILRTDRRKEVVWELMNSPKPVKDQEAEYYIKTGHSRADFYRIKAELQPHIEQYPKGKV